MVIGDELWVLNKPRTEESFRPGQSSGRHGNSPGIPRTPGPWAPTSSPSTVVCCLSSSLHSLSLSHSLSLCLCLCLPSLSLSLSIFCSWPVLIQLSADCLCELTFIYPDLCKCIAAPLYNVFAMILLIFFCCSSSFSFCSISL